MIRRRKAELPYSTPYIRSKATRVLSGLMLGAIPCNACVEPRPDAYGQGTGYICLVTKVHELGRTRQGAPCEAQQIPSKWMSVTSNLTTDGLSSLGWDRDHHPAIVPLPVLSVMTGPTAVIGSTKGDEGVAMFVGRGKGTRLHPILPPSSNLSAAQVPLHTIRVSVYPAISAVYTHSPIASPRLPYSTVPRDETCSIRVKTCSTTWPRLGS